MTIIFVSEFLYLQVVFFHFYFVILFIILVSPTYSSLFLRYLLHVVLSASSIISVFSFFTYFSLLSFTFRILLFVFYSFLMPLSLNVSNSKLLQKYSWIKYFLMLTINSPVQNILFFSNENVQNFKCAMATYQ